MRIQDITLTNYRLYRGINTISFPVVSEGKNMYLVSGENGFGKTTLLHSLLWCLYGRLMADIDETLRKEIANDGGYNTFLVRNLNNTARQYVEQVGTNTLARIKRTGYTREDADIHTHSVYSVRITFSDIAIPSVPCRTLTVTRSYDIIKTIETVDVLIDGQKNELTQSIGNDVFINDFILSKDIARFFFFDSERIVSLADTDTLEDRRRLASAYNEVLGVKKYEDLKCNLEALRLKFRKRTSDIAARSKLQTLLQNNERLQSEEKEITETIRSKENELTILRMRDNELQEKLLREGQGMTLADFNKQKLILETARNKDISIKTKLRDFIEYAPFAIVGGLLKDTMDEIAKDYHIAKLVHNITNQNLLLQSIYNRLVQSIQPLAIGTDTMVQQTIYNVLEQFREEEPAQEPLLHINKEIYNECQAVYANLTSTYSVEFEHLADDNKKNKQVINRVQQRLASMQSNEADEIIKQIRTQKESVEKQLSAEEENLRKLYARMGVISQEKATFKKQISELGKRVSLDDNDVKKDALAEQLIISLDLFLRNLKTEKKSSLEYRLKHILNSLMHKSDFIGAVNVRIMEDCLDIELISPAGNVIQKNMLSKGEQQLYATALLKALVEESGIEFPVFIDSPLQKFDKSHSYKIITEFYPSVSKQVVLFPLLHKELTETEMETMQPFVQAAYIIRNETDHSYFKAVDVSELMNY